MAADRSAEGIGRGGSPPTDNWSAIRGGSCPPGYNLSWQLTGQPRELIEEAAAQQIIVWAADQSAMELVEGAAAPQTIGQPFEGVAAQQDPIYQGSRPVSHGIGRGGSHPTDNWSAIRGGGCPTGYNLSGQPTGQPRELVEEAATQQIIVWAANQSALVSHGIRRMAATLQIIGQP